MATVLPLLYFEFRIATIQSDDKDTLWVDF